MPTDPGQPHRPTRVLHVVWSMDLGGLELVVMNLIRSADPARVRFAILCQSPHRPHFAEELDALGVDLLHGPPVTRLGRFAWNLWRVLRHGRYDVVHCHLHRSAAIVMAVAWLAGVRVRIAQSHNDLRARQLGPVRRAVVTGMRWVTTRLCTHGVAVSQFAAASLFTDAADERKLRIVPCGVDLTPFATVHDAPGLRRRLGIPDGALVVGNVSRIAPAKNHARFVAIAAAIRQREPRAHFLVVGDGPLRASVEQAVMRQGLAGAFTFTGQRQDVAKLLQHAVDVFLFPSLHEGLGLAVVEAQAAGLPCVVSTEVPGEAAVVPQLVTALPLEAGDATWADAVLAAAARRMPPAGEAYARCAASPCSVERCNRELHGLYAALRAA